MSQTWLRVEWWWRRQHPFVRLLIVALLSLIVLKQIQVVCELYWLKLPTTSLPDLDNRSVVQRMRSTDPFTREHRRHIVVLGLSRRGDDADFWALAAILGGWISLFRFGPKPPRQLWREANPRNIRLPVPTRQDWARAAGALMLVLILGMWLEPGTVFSDVIHSSAWTNHFGWVVVVAVQIVELVVLALALVGNLLVIRHGCLAAATKDVAERLARRPPSLEDEGDPRENRTPRQKLADACLRTVKWFAIYFTVSQVLTGARVMLDELVAVSYVTVVFIGPFLWLYLFTTDFPDGWHWRGLSARVLRLSRRHQPTSIMRSLFERYNGGRSTHSRGTAGQENQMAKQHPTGQPADYRPAPTSLAGEDEVLQRLLAEDSGSDQPRTTRPRFLYRGQPQRYERPYPPENRQGQAADSMLFESLIPSDYRGLEDAIRKGQRNIPGGLEPYRNEQAWVGSLITGFCLDRHADATKDLTSQRWIDEQLLEPPGQRFDRIGSVGQHYGLKTGYLDATSNPMTALWFATHNFQTYQPLHSGLAVIYRIDFDLLERAFSDVNAQENRTGRDACRATDIRATPPALAPRAAAQQGWSLINFEAPAVLIHLARNGGLVRFEFPRGTGISWRSRLGPHGFRPQPDPLVAVFDDVRFGRIPLHEMQVYVDRHFNSQLPPAQHVKLTTQFVSSRFL